MTGECPANITELCAQVTPVAKTSGNVNETRAKIMALEAAMLTLPQLDIPIKHYFAPGLYLREMAMPYGSLVTGKIHKTEHYCILASGSVAVVTERGSKTHHAPAVIHSLPGDKRALHALSDVVWINVHHNPTNERDIDKIDDIYVTNSFDEIGFSEQKILEGGV